MGKKVIWSKYALRQAESIHDYILEESKSLEIANSVLKNLFDSTEILETQWEIYTLDQLKQNNDGSYRAYVKYNYRISYRIMNNVVSILRVRHTSREPLEY